MKCILNKNIPKCVTEYFTSENIEVIYTDNCGAVFDSVGFHPDIQCTVIKDTLITSPLHFDYYRTFTKKILKSEKELASPYPFDVLFNCFILGNTVYGNEKYLDLNVKKIIFENNLKFFNVKQGYTNCSSLAVADNAVITSDKGMEKAFLQNGADVLFSDSSSIKLQGYGNGFIGGSACRFKDKIVFFGDIEAHPDYMKIYSFLLKYGIGYKAFPFELEDFGSALFFE